MLRKSLNIIKSIVLILVGIMLFSCENDISVVQSLQVDESVPIETSFNIVSEIVDSGRVRIRIKSPQIDRYEGEKDFIEMKKGVEVYFYDTLGQVSSSVTSDYAINEPSERKITAKYNVFATNREGDKLYTEKLIWDQKTKKIFTDVAVKVVSEDKIIFGDGMVADETFDNWQIKHPHGDIETEQLDIDDE